MTTLPQVCEQPISPGAQMIKVVWKTPSRPRHAFMAIACPEEEGGFSIVAESYPGVISQGETMKEAKANIAEAFLGMLEACKKQGKALSYQPCDLNVAANCIRVWIETDG